MSAIRVSVRDARAADQTAAPAVLFRLRLEAPVGRAHVLALRSQVRIDPQRRRYDDGERARLYELFGPPPQWSHTLRPLTWAQVSLVAPSFEHAIDVDLAVPCTYDLEIASAKYLHAVRSGTVPLVFLFSGTVFAIARGSVEVTPVSWDVECRYQMPAEVWRAAMDRFFPGDGWLRLGRTTLDRLQAYRGRHALVTWDDTLDRLLAAADAASAGTGVAS